MRGSFQKAMPAGGLWEELWWESATAASLRNMDIDSHSNAEELRKTFRDYAEYNRRDLEELRRKTVKKLLVELYKAAKDVAPTKGEIEAKVKSLGWRVVKRGKPEQWGALALRDLPKNNMRKMSKAERVTEKDRRKQAVESLDNKAKMEEYVIRKRASKIGFMASAYAVAASLLGIKVGRVPGIHAKASASDDGTTTVIEATAGGIEDVDKRTGFISKAIHATIADMRKYIYDRQQAGRQRFRQ